MKIADLQNDAVNLLSKLISIPSFSKEESKTADVIFQWLSDSDLKPQRHLNNVYAIAENGPERGKTILLNSHHDTVKPTEGWRADPFVPTISRGKLTGLGSNDAGASAVCLLAAFKYLSSLPKLPYTLIVAITAEEEISGKNGIEALLPELPKIHLGVVGEPTKLEIAVAERGLMVLDVEVTGKTGHAARNEGDNALYKAVDDIAWFRNYQFERASQYLGPISMAVTQIEAGTQHNVVPDKCNFVVDVRMNDAYSHQQVLDMINKNILGTATARSMRLKPSGIRESHPIIKHAQGLDYKLFGSATMSDQALMQFSTIKMGPGKSERSHTPDEYILVKEIEAGVEKYIELLEGFSF